MKLAFVPLAATLAACVAQPVLPTIPVSPAPGKSFQAFATEQAWCQQYAADRTAPAVEQANNQAIGSTLLTTALGAGLGGALGAAWGNAGQGAAIGAASGAVPGAVVGSARVPYRQAVLQQQYDVSYGQCMAMHGNIVPGFFSEPVAARR